MSWLQRPWDTKTSAGQRVLTKSRPGQQVRSDRRCRCRGDLFELFSGPFLLRVHPRFARILPGVLAKVYSRIIATPQNAISSQGARGQVEAYEASSARSGWRGTPLPPEISASRAGSFTCSCSERGFFRRQGNRTPSRRSRAQEVGMKPVRLSSRGLSSPPSPIRKLVRKAEGRGQCKVKEP
jgi:hypothetical protein